MMICFDYIVVLIVHKHIVVKEIFLDIQVDSNSGKYFTPHSEYILGLKIIYLLSVILSIGDV
jgi:uncharacterized membrane protein YhdT